MPTVTAIISATGGIVHLPTVRRNLVSVVSMIEVMIEIIVRTFAISEAMPQAISKACQAIRYCRIEMLFGLSSRLDPLCPGALVLESEPSLVVCAPLLSVCNTLIFRCYFALQNCGRRSLQVTARTNQQSVDLTVVDIV